MLIFDSTSWALILTYDLCSSRDHCLEMSFKFVPNFLSYFSNRQVHITSAAEVKKIFSVNEWIPWDWHNWDYEGVAWLCSFLLLAFSSLSVESWYTKFCVSDTKLTCVNETDNFFSAGWGNQACVCSDNTQAVTRACWFSPSMSWAELHNKDFQHVY